MNYQAILHHVDQRNEYPDEIVQRALGGFMRHDSNWLDYLRKLANEGNELSLGHKYDNESRSGMGVPHAAHQRDEWLQAGYSAQTSLPFRSGR